MARPGRVHASLQHLVGALPAEPQARARRRPGHALPREREDQQLELSTMTDLSIQREIVIDAPADVVWRTITEPAQIERWFFDRVELDVQPGGRGTFAFKGRETGEPVTVAIVVETVDAPRRFAFRWGRPTSGTPEPAGSILVDFTLSPRVPNARDCASWRRVSTPWAGPRRRSPATPTTTGAA